MLGFTKSVSFQSDAAKAIEAAAAVLLPHGFRATRWPPAQIMDRHVAGFRLEAGLASPPPFGVCCAAQHRQGPA